MNSLVSLWDTLACELGVLCGVDARRDSITVSRRSEMEGESFLRITLPSFGKAFLKALEEGEWAPTTHTGFARRGGLPVFLRGFLENIFTPEGTLRPDPCTESIRAVHQLTQVAGKIEGDCTPRRKNAAVNGYLVADDECEAWDKRPSQDVLHLLTGLSEVARLSLVPILSRADYLVKHDEIQPRHGPGQTADRLLGNKKYDLSYWPAHLEARFAWSDWAVPNYRYADCSELMPTHPSHVVPARLTLVPKTMSTPRVIVMEPTALQYMQQGIWTVMRESIESVTTMVGFTDQSVNRTMARSGSLTRELVTLDLSEASDRVTYLQAASCFDGLPNLWEALDATRSSEVELPDGSTRPISKFASMGSAVCFPVEAVVFLTAILLAIRNHHRVADPGFDLTLSFLRKLEGRVRVYGDDCIFPIDYLPAVETVFAGLGWRINRSKTFVKSNFRESCGGDYWRGEDITPVKLRQLLPTHRRQITEVQSLISTRNQFYMAGYWKTARLLDERIGKVLLGTFPIVEETSAALGRTSVSFKALCLGTDRYQRSLTRAWTIRTTIPKNQCSEVGALLKCLIAPGKDDEHLERSGRPVDVSINRRWMPVA